ncbi:MAG: retron St85 family RNA-directed DNA polymerase [Acidobacteriia bacterium]|nr:retron St85 family RNA-directed DNA polymerase [Terriglobia bacterium]
MMLEQMANGIGIPVVFIENLANAASYEYKTYTIRKRSGGLRTIHHPSRRLKALQRWLLANVIQNFPVHLAATAYAPGRSIFKNASVHATSRYLLRMDFTDFFPSITQNDVRSYVNTNTRFFEGWNSTDVNAFCNLISRNGVLTIGAPTSPAISNALCYDLDARLELFCSKSGVTYTRYADDLFFSADRSGTLRQIEEGVLRIVSELEIPRCLVINRAKTRHSSKRGTRRVTGIVLGSDGKPHIGRTLKRKIRASIHQFAALDDAGKDSLAGLIAFAVGFDPDFLNSLIKKYGLAAVRIAMKKPSAKTGGKPL